MLGFDKEAVTPESTGYVEYDGGPVTVTQTVDSTSTGNVPFDSSPQTVEVEWVKELEGEIVAKVVTPGPEEAPVTTTAPTKRK